MDRREYIKNSAALLGLAMSQTKIGKILSDWEKTSADIPTIFNEFQWSMVQDIAETICPKTQSPGAIELKVPEFIALMVKDTMSKKDQKAFQEGIQELDQQAILQFTKPYLSLAKEQKEKLLTRLDADSPHFPPTMWGIVLVENPAPITFFRRFKSLTLMGYFSSEKIGKDFLVYDPIPGKFIGCMPLNGQNGWSE